MTGAIIGELEDICGMLGDIEGEYQKTAEEAIKRIQDQISMLTLGMVVTK